MMTLAELQGNHLPNDGEGITLQDLLDLLKQIPRQARQNYIMCNGEDVAGLQFGRSNQAEKWEFKVHIKIVGDSFARLQPLLKDKEEPYPTTAEAGFSEALYGPHADSRDHIHLLLREQYEDSTGKYRYRCVRCGARLKLKSGAMMPEKKETK